MLARILFLLSEFHRRMLPVYLAALGPRWSYAVTRVLARWMYRLLLPVRIRSEVQCRAGLSGVYAADQAIRIAEEAYVHRIWDFVDLYLAPRLLHPGTYRAVGGAIPEPHLTNILDAQRRGQPAILISAYYGPVDLLPALLGYNGVHVAAIYKPHANAGYDAFRRRVRTRGGCELVPLSDAITRLPQVLSTGGMVALVADHHAERRGLPVTFLGLPTTAPKSVGLLAQQYRAEVVVAGIRRVGPFRFQIDVQDVFKPPSWEGEADPLRYITERYLRGLERLILADPAQYLWAQTRWGERFATQLEQTYGASSRANVD